MKNTFLVLLGVLFTFQVYSQTVIEDTATLEFQNKRWVEVVKVTLDNGEVTSTVKPVGDTSQVIPYFIKRHAALSDSYVDLIKRSMLSLNNSYNQIYKDNSALQLSGFPPLMSVLSQTYESKYVGVWRFRNEELNIKQVTVLGKEGKVLLKNEDKEYQILIFGNKHIRLLDYPEKGNMIDMFELQTNVFIDWSQTFILFK